MGLHVGVELLNLILVDEGELLRLLKRCLWHLVKLLLSIRRAFRAVILFVDLFVVIGNQVFVFALGFLHRGEFSRLVAL